MNDAVLSAKGLSVGYSGKAVLSGIEITAEWGRILTLIGPNGAGKSTLLKTLCRQLEPVGGKVFIGKDDISRMKSRDLAKNMAILLTQKVKTQLMTCREAVETGRFPYVGALAVMGDEDRKKWMKPLKWWGLPNLPIRILTSSVTVSDRECCLPVRYVRSRIYSYLMSLQLSSISAINWSSWHF